MKIKTFFISSLLLVFITACSSGEPDKSKLVISPGEAQAAASYNTQATMESQILRSTIRIEMFDVYRTGGGRKEMRIATGLGTIVNYEGHHFILTHNHWSIPAAELNKVEIRNGTGKLLLVLYQGAFYSLVRYQDEGTMLLDIPEGLTGVKAAELGDWSESRIGDPILLASNGNEGRQDIRIESGFIEGGSGSQGLGSLKILTAKREVISDGDSGGGVWSGNKIVGNIWSIIIENHTWEIGILSLGFDRSTNKVLVGVLPFLDEGTHPIPS